MNLARRAPVAILLLSLTAGLLGPGAAAADRRVTVANLMLTAADFVPVQDGLDYENTGTSIEVWGAAVSRFRASLRFPVPEAYIRRITLYAFDNSPTAGVGLSFHRYYPPGGNQELAAMVSTEDSPDRVQAPYTTDIGPRRINRATHSGGLTVSLLPGVRFFGVRITYSYES